MTTKHPFWQLVERPRKTDTDRVALAAIATLSTGTYSHLTLEQIYDDLTGDFNRRFAELDNDQPPVNETPKSQTTFGNMAGRMGL